MDMRAFIEDKTPTIQDWQEALSLVEDAGVSDMIIVITRSRFCDGDDYQPELDSCYFVNKNGVELEFGGFYEKFLSMFYAWFTGNDSRYGYDAPRLPSQDGKWTESICWWLYNRCDQSLDGYDYVHHRFSLKTLNYLGVRNEHRSTVHESAIA